MNRPAHPARPRYDHYDVLIAGARAAGASTALLLARQGLRVLVVDPVPRGRDTLSTHALMRGGVLQLHRWGLLDQLRRAETPAISATTFDYGANAVTIPIKSKDGVDALYAPRRTVLDPILVDAAEGAGAEVIHGLSLTTVSHDAQGRVDGAWILDGDRDAFRVSATWVVGADGSRSPTAQRVGAPVLRSASCTTASIYGYAGGLPRDEYRWFFRPRLGAGVIPTNGGQACVFVSVPAQELRAVGRQGMAQLFRDRLRSVDVEWAERLEADSPTGRLRAFPGRPGFIRQAHGPGWALVGDAGYFRDPLTAHGITDALRDAELLARALLQGTEEALQAYQTLRDSAAVGLMEVTDRIASLEWSMEEVQALHHDLNREMNVGLTIIRELGVDGTRSAEAA